MPMELVLGQAKDTAGKGAMQQCIMVVVSILR